MPLHLAIIKGHFSVVIALLERGADVSAVCRCVGHAPLSIMLASGRR
jgi:ankyrin repeat protein